MGIEDSAALADALRRDERCPALYVHVAELSETCLATWAPARPDGVVLAGCVGRHGVERLAAKLAVMEAEQGLPDGATRIVALVGTARGALALPSLARQPSPRLAAIAHDPCHLGRELSCEPDSASVSQAAATTVLVAAAAGVPSIYAAADDPHAWRRAAALGFRGVIVAEPDAVVAAREHFSGIRPGSGAAR